jgi:hypothetical protein
MGDFVSGSTSLLVSVGSDLLFLYDSVLVSNIFLEICPLLLGYPFIAA